MSASERSLRTVVVTGAGSGLGRAIARRLLSDGYRCVLAGLEEQPLKETVAGAERVDSVAERAVVVVGDVSAAEDRARIVQIASDEPGELFGLVNNAGIGRMRAFLDETVEEWQATFAVNLEAAFFLSQAAVERMRARGAGRIVNIASMHGMVGMNNRGLEARVASVTPGDRGPVRGSAYAASKGGVIQMTRDVAAAVGRWGITVNSVSPGNVPHGGMRPTNDKSPGEEGRVPQLGDPLDQKTYDAMCEQTMLGRVGWVEEIAGPVSFLLSDDAGYMTGANLVVDGGFTSW